MERLPLHELHQSLKAALGRVNGVEVVQDYGNPLAEYDAMRNTACVIDLSHRGRVCLTGNDRARFLNGQVTNNIKVLQTGQGCYAALVTAKGKMEGDLHVHCLQDELLIDFEPGLTEKIIARLQKYMVADDVELVDLMPLYGHLSVQGLKAAEILQSLNLADNIPTADYQSVTVKDDALGELVIAVVPRLPVPGIDLFVPTGSAATLLNRLLEAARAAGGCAGGWTAMEMLRIEGGIPRFGQDMDETNIPLEAGIEDRAVRYNKGCYIGQEVINRIHSIGQVTKSLCGLILPDGMPELPARGTELVFYEKTVGYVTSAVHSPLLNRNIALGYLRKEANQPGNTVPLKTGTEAASVRVVELPFKPDSV